MFRILDTALEPSRLRQALHDTRAGAFAAFEGIVRDLNDGRTVLALDYESYAPLAEKEGDRILAEALDRFAVIAVGGAHRTGRLEPGDMAVWVGVVAEHRGPAFDACRFIVDQLKARVPIWKREHYAEGPSAWINPAAGRPS
jgi:molybdopterin synthase catalytic subunit